ncbi:MAG: hypothetical protein BWK73_25435 [Thiothrix lacustris]|uniref:Uncharacterized protein n=1 Tax=Thiothrix lacustris TaxID=525917 RepID=A0A1Y1QL64_9GAMM|nr:MAG: hypothetical protein BWK73_25435 [Thiothrix lacustris]
MAGERDLLGAARANTVATAKQQYGKLSDIVFCKAPYEKEQGIFHVARVAGAWGFGLLGAVQIGYVLHNDLPASLAAIGFYFWWNATRLALGIAPSLAVIADNVVLAVFGTAIFSGMFFHKADVNVNFPIEVSWEATTKRMTSSKPVQAATCPSQTVINNEYAATLSKPIGKLSADDFAPLHAGEWVNCVHSRKLDTDEIGWCRDTQALAGLANKGKFTPQHLVTACYRLPQ